MKKGYIVLAVLIVVALVAGIIWMQQNGEDDETANTSTPTTQNTTPESQDTTQNEEEATEPEAAGELTIVYDGSGFSPSTLTVSQGDTVTFRNNSSTEVWPASDDHPVHSDLSGFDALRGLGQGEEYSFTFDQAGDWGYHNHLNPSQTGTIIVE